MVPFSDPNDLAFKRAILEIDILTRLAKYKCPHVLVLRDFFIIEQDPAQAHKSQAIVLVYEPFEVSIEEIGLFRSTSALHHWAEHEIDEISMQMVNALRILEREGIFHNDVRGSNIYYSPQKMSYLLANFSEASIGVPVYKGVPAFKNGAHAENDLYGMARTLACALELDLWNVDPSRPKRGNYAASVTKQLARGVPASEIEDMNDEAKGID